MAIAEIGGGGGPHPHPHPRPNPNPNPNPHPNPNPRIHFQTHGTMQMHTAVSVKTVVR